MSEKILLVDDDPNLLAGCERHLRRQFQIETAEGGETGLAKLASRGPFAVVVSDRQMPLMDGITFLATVRQRAPDTVRIMLTGNVDLEQAVKVVNEGNIFRFLIKPCPQDTLMKTIQDGIAQHRLIVAEKELLSKTLSGSIKLLTDILSSMDSKSVNRTERLRTLINEVAQKTGTGDVWDVHLAAMLASIGYVTLPAEIVVKAREKQMLSKKEEQLVNNLPEISARLLSNIPRLESVAHIIRYQQKNFDGTGFPADSVKAEQIPFGARLLKIFNDLSRFQAEGMGALQGLNDMQRCQGWYDPQLLSVVRTCYGGDETSQARGTETIAKKVKELEVGMILASNISTTDENLILPAGHHINEMTLEKIQNFSEIIGIKEPIFVEAKSLPANG